MINLKIFKILFDMTRIGWIIIGILVYFLLGWILKDIVFSIITIEGDTTMGDILKYEQIVYSALTAIYIIIMNIVQGDDNGDSSSPISYCYLFRSKVSPSFNGKRYIVQCIKHCGYNLGSLRVEKRLNKKKSNGRVFNDNISRSSRWFYLFTYC